MSDLAVPLPEDLIEALTARVLEQVAERQPRYLSRRALAEHYGVAERTVRTWRERGLPGLRVGREVMYEVEAVDRWIESHA